MSIVLLQNKEENEPFVQQKLDSSTRSWYTAQRKK